MTIYNPVYQKRYRESHKESNKLYQKEYRRLHYNKEYHKNYYKSHREVWQRYTDKKRQEGLIVLNALRSKPCMDCKQTFPMCVMQFDHRPNEQKKCNVPALMCSPNMLKKEIAKCDVVCANCHQIREFNRDTYSKSGKKSR